MLGSGLDAMEGMMNNIETRFSWQSKDADTAYNLIPNPDGAATDYSEGAYLTWEDPPEWKAQGHFFIPPDGLRAFAEMLSRAADIAEGVK